MIRKLTAKDAQKYRELRLLALTTDPDAYFLVFESESKRDSSSFASEISSHRYPFGYVGWFDENDQLVAYVQVAPSYGRKTSHVADLYNLYVHPQFRNQEIANRLLESVLQSIQEQSVLESVFLSVMRENVAAIHLYENLGFLTYGIKERSLKVQDHYFDEVLMRYDFLR